MSSATLSARDHRNDAVLYVRSTPKADTGGHHWRPSYPSPHPSPNTHRAEAKPLRPGHRGFPRRLAGSSVERQVLSDYSWVWICAGPHYEGLLGLAGRHSRQDCTAFRARGAWAGHRLKQPRDIEEPPEESRRTDLHLDHDTKGLKGSPEVAHEIFKKISVSTVVVADVDAGRHHSFQGWQRTQTDDEPERCNRTGLCIRQSLSEIGDRASAVCGMGLMALSAEGRKLFRCGGLAELCGIFATIQLFFGQATIGHEFSVRMLALSDK
jgi:hypothetical protein